MTKRKPGRPPLPARERKEVHCVRLDAQDVEDLARLAQLLGTTECDVLRQALRAYVYPVFGDREERT